MVQDAGRSLNIVSTGGIRSGTLSLTQLLVVADVSEVSGVRK